VFRHRLAKCGQRVRETNELVELRLLLGVAIILVVEVLAATGCIEACGLELRGRPG
jgi:hypothetical protein